MKLLLGSLLLAGICWLGATVVVPIMPNFNNERIAKVWYPLLTIPTGHVVTTHFYPFRFLAQPNGNLKYSIRISQNGRCMTVEEALTEQGQPGDYANSEVPWTLRFVETDYNTYAIGYITQGSGNKDTFLALVGTLPTVTPALETKFRQVANSLGITGEIVPNVLKATC